MQCGGESYKVPKALKLFVRLAAVSCSPVTPRLGADENGVGFDGQAGPCMGRCMGAWVVMWWWCDRGVFRTT